jgi:hypothetical protein
VLLAGNIFVICTFFCKYFIGKKFENSSGIYRKQKLLTEYRKNLLIGLSPVLSIWTSQNFFKPAAK